MIKIDHYNVKCCVDVAQLTTSPQAAYEFFQLHWQSTFDLNDRIVLYSSHPWPMELLQHLYAATELIDISNCFVLLAGPVIAQHQVLQLAINNQAFETLITDLDEATQPLKHAYQLSKSMCPLPWMHLEIKNQGEISPCCISSKYIGTVSDTGIQAAFDGQGVANFRQQFLIGDRPNECQACWKLEDKGLTSNRIRHLSFLKKDLLTKYLSNPKIVSLDLKPGNTCNFKCRICGPRASSQFAQEQSKFDSAIPIKSYNWAESTTQVMDEVEQLLPNIENLDLYGGEPFLIKPLAQLVKRAVDLGVASQIRLHYNSNGSVFPADLLPYWSHFKHIDVHFSIDNVGKRFELERGGSWAQVDRNITQLVELQLTNVNISIMPVISIMNIYYLDELLAWCNRLKLPINALYLDQPEPFALSNLTQEAKDMIVDKFSNSDWPDMQQILKFIQTQPSADGSKFADLTKHFDKLRNQDFRNTHKDIAIAMRVC